MIYDKFPIEFYVYSRIVVNTKSDLEALINKYNCYSNIFASVYSFEYELDGLINYNTAKIDKLFFDFDLNDYENSSLLLEDIRKFNKEIKKYKRIIAFSGRGFHIYISHDVGENRITYKDEYIKNYQLSILNNLNLKIDNTCIGRKEKLARIINTRNNKSRFKYENIEHRLYCIALKEKEIEYSFEDIQKLALKQRKINIIDGISLEYNKDFDIFDKSISNIPLINYSKINIKTDNKYIAMIQLGIDIESLPPCIEYLINTQDHSYQERCYLILYFKHCGLSIEETRSLLKLILDSSRYYHVTGEKIGNVDRKYLGRVENQDRNLYHKDYYISCSRLKDIGICFGDCKYNDILHNLVIQ